MKSLRKSSLITLIFLGIWLSTTFSSFPIRCSQNVAAFSRTNADAVKKSMQNYYLLGIKSIKKSKITIKGKTNAIKKITIVHALNTATTMPKKPY
ncbi:MAG: hypothetical protein JRI87_11310 [Deltaproteobacteria bacterium]|nr:hypothetical protein [Deltaproteobacteria bacterium]